MQVDASCAAIFRALGHPARLASLIRTEKRGQWVHCTVNPAALELVETFLRPGGPPEAP
ncbi:MAG: hypothetical protein HY728_03430 [Candidatus Rokubacteria bacterium]|nr:hypothetical protein [Candidatus Rokubacteria bacterium]